jgi:hypothetical protein
MRYSEGCDHVTAGQSASAFFNYGGVLALAGVDKCQERTAEESEMGFVCRLLAAPLLRQVS